MQGDVWQIKSGERGLEVGRDDKRLKLALINPLWPFPSAPEWFKKSECKKMPSRYHGNEVIEEAML